MIRNGLYQSPETPQKAFPTNPGYIQWDSILRGRATNVNLLYIPPQPIMG